MNAFGGVDKDTFNNMRIDFAPEDWSSMSSRFQHPTPIKYSNTPQETVQGMQLQPYRPPARNDPLSQIRTGVPTSTDNSMYDHHYIRYGVGAIAVYIVYRMIKK